VLSIRILVALGETEIDDEDVVLVLIVSSNQKVIRLNISMDNPLFVDLLNSLNHLDGDAENSLEVELAAALLEEIFEGLAE
jgi:hypothetical protein